jgi:glycosyltransferase involved in cell wall biosynthesis
MPLSVLALCRYSSIGASSRQRFFIYRDALKSVGIDTTIAQFFDDSYLLARYSGKSIWQAAARAYAHRIYTLLSLKQYDLLWVEKEMVPFLPVKIERLLFRNHPYVIDIDDAWFFKYQNHRSHFVRYSLGSKFEQLVRGSALTLVGNEYLGTWAKTSGAPNVHFLPTIVDLHQYQQRPPPDGPFTIGWIGTPMTVRYLEHIAAPLRQLCDGTTAQLRIIGDTNFRLAGVCSVSDPWDKATEAQLISRCHIGIMPLPDDPWVHGKCGYKLIQFLAAGRAVVTTPTEANRAILGDGKAGFLAATDDEWLRALTQLRDDPQLRAQMAAAGRCLVEQDYCLSATVGDLARHLFAAAGKHQIFDITESAQTALT